MNAMDEALRAFLAESREGLEQLEVELVDFERDPGNPARLGTIFRSVHTIKGSCGFFGLNRLEHLTHAAEDVLAQLREGRLAYSRELAGLLFDLIDAVRAMLTRIEESGHEGEHDHAVLVARFRKFGSAADTHAPAAAAGAGVTDEAEHAGPRNESAVRVDVALLDTLMDVVGELVLTRNQILQQLGAQNDPALTAVVQRLNHVTRELQEGVMKTRMQPISTLWNSYPRLLRDLALQTGKEVRLLREGGDTELDRTLLQAIKDPLVHLLRNAVDHGLEPPELRRAAGKPAQGLIKLRALHESGYVIVELSDDGAGIDGPAVLARALAQGLVKPEQAEQAGEREMLELLFRPGFSTAAAVTSLSGRGVGLDVVRSNVARVGGTVEIQSWPGRGTTFKVRIPLTLAIIPAVIISCGHQRYAVPQVNIGEIVHLAAEEAAMRIEAVHDTHVYRLRDRLLPLVDLRTLLQLPARDGAAAVFILVLQADGREFGLLVDHVRDTEEIVVKPLGRYLKGTRCFAGATIMGDGRVALILDALAIAQQCGVSGELPAQRQTSAGTTGAAGAAAQERLLLVRVGGGTAALPLSWVKRLEEFPATCIEPAVRGEMIQYRDHILPLVRLARLLDLPAAPTADTVHVVVHQEGDELVGLVVDGIVDIVAASADALAQQGRSGQLTRGLAVVQGRITELLDTDFLSALWSSRLPAVGLRPALETSHE